MKCFRSSLVLLAVASLTASASDPSPDDLLQRHIDARGGRAALEALKVVERFGAFTFHGIEPPAEGKYHTCIRYPDRVAIDIDAGPVQVHQVLGDHAALECDRTFESCSPAPPPVEEELRSTAREANREELYDEVPANTPFELLYEGGGAVGYRYQKDERMVELEFDPESGLGRRRKVGPRERWYSDWKDAGGVLLPMLLEDFEDGEPTVTVELAWAKHTATPSEWCLARFGASAAAGPRADAAADETGPPG